MANTLGYYNPVFYAQEALIQLEKVLGMASRVHLGYDREHRTFGKGDTINIRRPTSFTAGDAPATATDLSPDSVQISLDYWREVKFKLSDKELTLTREAIIEEHIRPAAYALADDIDQKLCLLYKDVPWHYNVGGTPGVSDITGTRKVMFDNKVPLREVNNMHFMIDGTLEEAFLKLSAFSQQQGAGDPGVNTQRTGSLGMKYGLELFSNQNVQSHTAGVCSDASGTVNGAHAVGATTLSVANVTATGTVKAGDTLVIAGNTQRHAITADATASGGVLSLTITPKLPAALSGSEVVTLDLTTHTANMAFHRNAFAIVTARMDETGNELGAKIASIQDPITGLALRSRMYYVGNSSEVHVALDVLYGVKTLDGNLACRARVT